MVDLVQHCFIESVLKDIYGNQGPFNCASDQGRGRLGGVTSLGKGNKKFCKRRQLNCFPLQNLLFPLLRLVMTDLPNNVTYCCLHEYT